MPGELDYLDKHFASAGITDEPAAADTTDENTDATPVDNTPLTQADVTSGDKETVAKPEAGKEPAAAAKDSTSGKSDGTVKPGTKEEAKGASAPKSLTLPDGTVIEGGKERRFYEQAQIAKQQLTAVQGDLTKARSDYTALQTTNQQLTDTLKAFQVADPAQAQDALKLYNDIAQNPIQTVQRLLAELGAAGYDISGVVKGFDAQVMKSLLDERLPPAGASKSQEQVVADALESARVETEAFLRTYPDAALHDHTLGKVIEREKCSPTEAYFMLKTAFANRGYDWSKTLEDNAGAPGQQQQQAAATTPAATAKPMQPGRGGAAAVVETNDKVAIAPDNMSMGDIIKASMRENGMNI